LFRPKNKLDQRSVAWIERAAALVEQHVVPYHRAEVAGVERIPSGPALYVGNHNGGMMSMDTFVLGAAVFRARGMQDLFFALAHDSVVDPPILGPVLRQLGAVRAHPEIAWRLFDAGYKVLVYPGGDVEAMRPYRERFKVKFAGRRGYIRMALRCNVPIIPVVSAGSHGTFLVLDDLPGLARLIGADRRMRLSRWPLILSLPWGVTLGPGIPYWPWPTQILIEVLEPIYFQRTGLDASRDEAYVRRCAAHVEWRLQQTLDVLRLRLEARSLPDA
jgi:1-acyl-sn-glycerol-3-phosphate acyltransferase